MDAMFFQFDPRFVFNMHQAGNNGTYTTLAVWWFEADPDSSVQRLEILKLLQEITFSNQFPNFPSVYVRWNPHER